MKKTVRIAEKSLFSGKCIARSVPVSKTFEFGGLTFYIVKYTKYHWRGIEAITGAPISELSRTVSGAYAAAMEKLTKEKDILKPSIEKWLKDYGFVEDLPLSILRRFEHGS